MIEQQIIEQGVEHKLTANILGHHSNVLFCFVFFFFFFLQKMEFRSRNLLFKDLQARLASRQRNFLVIRNIILKFHFVNERSLLVLELTSVNFSDDTRIKEVNSFSHFLTKKGNSQPDGQLTKQNYTRAVPFCASRERSRMKITLETTRISIHPVIKQSCARARVERERERKKRRKAKLWEKVAVS